MDIENLLGDMLSRPLSSEKEKQLSDSLSWYLTQNLCDHSFRVTADVCREIYANESEVIAWLRAQGAGCDCEAGALLAAE